MFLNTSKIIQKNWSIEFVYYQSFDGTEKWYEFKLEGIKPKRNNVVNIRQVEIYKKIAKEYLIAHCINKSSSDKSGTFKDKINSVLFLLSDNLISNFGSFNSLNSLINSGNRNIANLTLTSVVDFILAALLPPHRKLM